MRYFYRVTHMILIFFELFNLIHLAFNYQQKTLSKKVKNSYIKLFFEHPLAALLSIFSKTLDVNL